MGIKLSLSKRLLLAFSIMILMVVVASGVGLWYALRVQQTITAINAGNEQFETLNQLQSRWFKIAASVDNMLISRESKFSDEALEDLEEFKGLLAQIEKPLFSFSPTYVETNQPVAQEIVGWGKTLGDAVDQILEYGASQSWPQIANHRFRVLRVSQYPFNKKLDELRANTQAELEQLNAQVAQTQQQARLYWGAAIIIAIVTVLVAGVSVIQSITRPVNVLIEQTRRVTRQDFSPFTPLTQRDEIGELSRTFAQMTDMLRKSYVNLEQRVTERTRRLETVATLGEQLSAILNVEQLLAELVNQIKTSFDYYHAHIYLFDGRREKLVVAAGVGQAGATMKAAGHNIPLNAVTSLVARAARTGEIVWVDDVRESSDWLPNPLLPDTRSEMAVPINLEGRVVGVLDVQSDRVGGFDEGDASTLRSLANQVAVAMRNARLFEEVESALANVRSTQERYIEQSWDKARIAPRAGHYLYARPDDGPPDESKHNALVKARQQGLMENRPAVVSLNEEDLTGQSLVVPIKLSDNTIGAVQLHNSNGDQAWSNDDLAVIEAIIDQIAQTAENLRLFDETRQRASREKLTRQITDKVRAAPDVATIIQTGLQELAQALQVPRAYVKLNPAPAEPDTHNPALADVAASEHVLE